MCANVVRPGLGTLPATTRSRKAEDSGPLSSNLAGENMSLGKCVYSRTYSNTMVEGYQRGPDQANVDVCSYVNIKIQGLTEGGEISYMWIYV